MDRKEFLKAAGLATVGAGTRSSPSAQAAEVSGVRRRALRIAHLTDIHVQPERGAPAAWWNGDYFGNRAGYAIVDLYDDGSFDRAYLHYESTPASQHPETTESDRDRQETLQ